MIVSGKIRKNIISFITCLFCILAISISQFGIIVSATDVSAKYEKTDSGLIVTSNTFDENVERVEIGNDVIAILDGSFSKLKNLKYISVDSKNRFYASYEGCLYNKGYTKLLCIPQNIDEINILNSVENYSEHALDGITQEKKDKLDSLIASGFEEDKNTVDYASAKSTTNSKKSETKKNDDTNDKEAKKSIDDTSTTATNNNLSVNNSSASVDNSSDNSSSTSQNSSYTNTSTQSSNGWWFNGEEYYENGRSHYDIAYQRDLTFEETVDKLLALNSDPDFVTDCLWMAGWSKVGEYSRGFWFNGEEYYENGRSHYDCGLLRDLTFDEIVSSALETNSDPDFVTDILWIFGWSKVGE